MKPGRPNRSLLILAGLNTSFAWPAAAFLWVRSGEKALAASLILLGLSLGPLLAVYALVPNARKQAARHAVLFTGGLSIMAFSLLGRMNLDLEGFFMLIFIGTMGAAVGHTLVTVILGPIFFGRLLCGWGCWRSMVLELLPIRHSPGRRVGPWALLPSAGLAASISGAAVLVFALGHSPGGAPGAFHSATVEAIAISFAVYYIVSIGLAFALKDQRAFCKYLCPGGAILGLTSRLSFLKMAADGRLCNDCGACSRICPMDIDVAQFAVLGQRVASGQCILCQRCAHACPTAALRLTAGFDIGRRTPFLGERDSK